MDGCYDFRQSGSTMWPESLIRYDWPGPLLNIKTVFPGIGIYTYKIKRSGNNMGEPILVRQHLYIETAPGVETNKTLRKMRWNIFLYRLSKQDPPLSSNVSLSKRQVTNPRHHTPEWQPIAKQETTHRCINDTFMPFQTFILCIHCCCWEVGYDIKITECKAVMAVRKAWKTKHSAIPMVQKQQKKICFCCDINSLRPSDAYMRQ